MDYYKIAKNNPELFKAMMKENQVPHTFISLSRLLKMLKNEDTGRTME